MKTAIRVGCFVSLLNLVGLLMSASSFAAETALPAKSQEQSSTTQSVQRKVNKGTADVASEKRKKLFADATIALAETKKALKALENKKDEALKALAEVTGKLDIIVARDPKLAMTPVDTEVVTYDVLANPDTIK